MSPHTRAQFFLLGNLYYTEDMKLISEEFYHSYKKYCFGYKVLAELEPGDSIDNVYAAGFLPYSGSGAESPRYYMARSCRVLMDLFVPSSENRRIMKKFEGRFTVTVEKASAIANNREAIDFCLDYFKKRHDEEVMDEQRLQYILNYSPETSVAIYRDNAEKIVAYVLENTGEKSSHFWFSFYDLYYAFQSLGLWLMLDRLSARQNEGISHCYLGTVYGEKALYKTNFPGLEYWDGTSWQNDVEHLKSLARSDAEREL